MDPYFFKGVLFDFDMTLIDSCEAITFCMNLLASDFGLRKLSQKEVLATIGLPIEEAWEKLWGYYDPAWLKRYREGFRNVEESMLKPFPETQRVLTTLHDRGIRMGVVSNRRFTRAIVEKVGLDPFFDVVIGLEQVSRAKPDPEALLLALSSLKIDPEYSCYVGDTPIDMKTANAARIKGIGVQTGAFDRTALLDAGAWLTLDNLDGLLAVVDKMEESECTNC